MRTKLLLILIFISLGLPAARAQLEVWLAPGIGPGGTGAVTDPFNVGTQDRFDSLLRSYYKSGRTGITFHLAPGTYYTLGGAQWRCLSNWKFHGAGMDTTVVKLSGWSCVAGKPFGQVAVIAQEPWLRTGIEVTDLTIDCSWLDFGAALAGPFTVPAPGTSVSVPVSSSTWATPGIYAFIQRKDDYHSIGIYQVQAVTSGSSVLLKNIQGADDRAGNNLPQGTLIKGPVFVGPAVNTCGIDIGARDCRVERVHVTNTGTPIYEACLGISIAHINNPTGNPFLFADGNVIRDCLVDNLWGTAGWGISILSNNPDRGNTGTFISALVDHNIVHSNGYHQGLGSYGTASSTWRNNTVTDCKVGWFTDVGYNQDDQILDNIFINNGQAIQLGGGYINGWVRFAITGNHILIPQDGNGLLYHGQVHQSVFSDNQILAMPGATRGCAITVTPSNTGGNIFSNNVISASLTNSIPPGTGHEMNNITPEGGPITLAK